MTVIELKLCKAMLECMIGAIKECPALKGPLKPVQSVLTQIVEGESDA